MSFFTSCQVPTTNFHILLTFYVAVFRGLCLFFGLFLTIFLCKIISSSAMLDGQLQISSFATACILDLQNVRAVTGPISGVT